MKVSIELDNELFEYLKKESLKTGKSISELIVEKLKKSIESEKELIKTIDNVSGIWSNKNDDVDSYIRDLREGKNRIQTLKPTLENIK